MGQYRKKPVVIEALQWTGNNATEIQLFAGERLNVSTPPRGMEIDQDIPNEGYTLTIPTLEGDMKAIRGDYIIKGVKGEFYPCKPDIFEMTYEPIDDYIGPSKSSMGLIFREEQAYGNDCPNGSCNL